MAAIAVLPLDRASVVVPTPDTPNLVLKHSDGDLIRVRPLETGAETDRRHESAVTWWGGDRYNSLEEAVLAAADMQGFSARRGGEPSDIFELDLNETIPTESVELVPLDLGGVVLDDPAHLPLVLHTTDGGYWRLSMPPSADSPEYLLSRKPDDVSSWETVETYDEAAAVVDGLPPLLDETDIPYTTDASAQGMREVIESPSPEFATETPDHLSDDVADRADVQTRRLDWDK